MGIKATDLFMMAAFTSAIKDLRKNEFLWADIIGQEMLTDPLLKDAYGAQEVEKFSQFFKKEIQISLDNTINMAKIPAIAISVGGGNELSQRDVLGDGYESEKVDPSSLLGVTPIQPIRLGPFTAESYDKVTGKLVAPNNISFAGIYDSMVIYDEINKVSHPISVVLDDKTLYLNQGVNLNTNGMTIRLASNQVAHTRKYFFTQEDVTLTLMATSVVEVIYLYNIVMYSLGRYRIQLFDNKNFRAMTLRYGKIEKVQDDPQNVYAREIVIGGEVTHDYIVATAPLIQGMSNRIDISDMSATPASFIPDVKAQGWGSPEDQ